MVTWSPLCDNAEHKGDRVNDHPTVAELEGFVWNRLSTDRVRDIVAHLVRGCEPCLATVAPHWAGILGWEEPPAPNLSSSENADYEGALDRAFAITLARDRENRKRKALSLIWDKSSDELPEVPPHLQGLPLFEALLEKSWSLRHENAEEMVKVAEWARVLADHFDPKELGSTTVMDLRCRAWIELGNAHRVSGNLPEAEGAMGVATECFMQGTKDDLLAARFFDVQASLLGDSRRFDLAGTALDVALAIYRRLGDRHLTGRTLIGKAMYAGYQGNSEEALRLLEHGIELIDEDRDPTLVFLAFHNMARLLADCGRLRDARITLWQLEMRGLDVGGRINELKVKWLSGHINIGLGEWERAEVVLLAVRRGFEEINLPYKAALAGLELALVMLHRGRPDAAVREVLAAVQVFISLGVAREANASVLLLVKAIEEDMLETKVLEYAIEKLREAEEAPGGPFDPPAE